MSLRSSSVSHAQKFRGRVVYTRSGPSDIAGSNKDVTPLRTSLDARFRTGHPPARKKKARPNSGEPVVRDKDENDVQFPPVHPKSTPRSVSSDNEMIGDDRFSLSASEETEGEIDGIHLKESFSPWRRHDTSLSSSSPPRNVRRKIATSIFYQTPSPTFLPEPVLSQHGRQSDQNIRHSRSIGDFSMSDNLSSSHLSSASSMSENQDDSSTRSTSPVTSKSASRVTAAHAGVGSLLYTPTSLWRPSSPQSPVSQALPSHSSSSASTPKFDISNLPRPPTRAQQVVSEFQRHFDRAPDQLGRRRTSSTLNRDPLATKEFDQLASSIRRGVDFLSQVVSGEVESHSLSNLQRFSTPSDPSPRRSQLKVPDSNKARELQERIHGLESLSKQLKAAQEEIEKKIASSSAELSLCPVQMDNPFSSYHEPAASSIDLGIQENIHPGVVVFMKDSQTLSIGDEEGEESSDLSIEAMSICRPIVNQIVYAASYDGEFREQQNLYRRELEREDLERAQNESIRMYAEDLLSRGLREADLRSEYLEQEYSQMLQDALIQQAHDTFFDEMRTLVCGCFYSALHLVDTQVLTECHSLVDECVFRAEYLSSCDIYSDARQAVNACVNAAIFLVDCEYDLPPAYRSIQDVETTDFSSRSSQRALRAYNEAAVERARALVASNSVSNASSSRPTSRSGDRVPFVPQGAKPRGSRRVQSAGASFRRRALRFAGRDLEHPLESTERDDFRAHSSLSESSSSFAQGHGEERDLFDSRMKIRRPYSSAAGDGNYRKNILSMPPLERDAFPREDISSVENDVSSEMYANMPFYRRFCLAHSGRVPYIITKFDTLRMRDAHDSVPEDTSSTLPGVSFVDPETGDPMLSPLRRQPGERVISSEDIISAAETFPRDPNPLSGVDSYSKLEPLSVSVDGSPTHTLLTFISTSSSPAPVSPGKSVALPRRHGERYHAERSPIAGLEVYSEDDNMITLSGHLGYVSEEIDNYENDDMYHSYSRSSSTPEPTYGMYFVVDWRNTVSCVVDTFMGELLDDLEHDWKEYQDDLVRAADEREASTPYGRSLQHGEGIRGLRRIARSSIISTT